MSWFERCDLLSAMFPNCECEITSIILAPAASEPIKADTGPLAAQNFDPRQLLNSVFVVM